MPYKDPIKQKEAQHRHFVDNREQYKESSLSWKRKRVEKFQEFRQTLSCIKCGENRAPCLEFHHPNFREGKEPCISYLVRRVSWEKLMEAIKECDVLCANCHKMEHWNGQDFLPSPNDGITKKPDSFNNLGKGKQRH